MCTVLTDSYILFVQNEQKLKQATENYERENNSSFDRMVSLLKNRFNEVTPSVGKFLTALNRFYGGVGQVFAPFSKVENAVRFLVQEEEKRKEEVAENYKQEEEKRKEEMDSRRAEFVREKENERNERDFQSQQLRTKVNQPIGISGVSSAAIGSVSQSLFRMEAESAGLSGPDKIPFGEVHLNGVYPGMPAMRQDGEVAQVQKNPFDKDWNRHYQEFAITDVQKLDPENESNFQQDPFRFNFESAQSVPGAAEKSLNWDPFEAAEKREANHQQEKNIAGTSAFKAGNDFF